MSASGTEINPALLAKVPAYGRVMRGTSPCASSVVANAPLHVCRCVAEFGSKRRDRHWMSRCTFWHSWHSTPQPATSLVGLNPLEIQQGFEHLPPCVCTVATPPSGPLGV